MMTEEAGVATPQNPPLAQARTESAAPLTVGSIAAVARSRLQTVAPDSPLVEVTARLSNAQISAAVVCDVEGRPLGLVTETMLVRRLGLGQADFFGTGAAAVMTREFASCLPEDSLSEVLAMMHERGLIHLLLLDAEGQALGLLNARDGLRALLAAGMQEEALLRNYVMGVGYQ